MFNQLFTDQEYRLPSDDIDPELKKQSDYALKWAKGVYQLHVKDQGGIRYTKLQDIDLNRQYAEGRQPVKKYLDILCPKNNKGERKSYLDISTDILSIIPKFRSIIIGKFIQMEHNISADAIDENSGAEREGMRYSLWAKARIKEIIDPLEKLLGMVEDPSEIKEILPKTVEELDMLQGAGKFKLKWEAGMEKLLNDASYSSNWDNIRVKLYEDIFDLGICAIRDYTDKVTGKAKVRYVDPKRLIVRHSKEHLYTNIDYAGEIVDMTPNQIRIDAGGDMTSDQINEVIRLYRDSNNLDLSFNESINELYEQHGNLNVKVLDLTFKSIDTYKQEKKIDKNGHARYYSKPYNHEISNSQKESNNREVLVGKRQMVYKCKWIVGSNYVYDFGLAEDILRKDIKTAELPFSIYRLSRKSMLDSIIPLEDHIQLAWMKFQNALAKAAPGGIAVDVGALKNITNGKNKLQPLQLLQIRRQTGDLLFKSTTHHSQVINPNSGRPIIDLPGGAGAELDEHIKVIDFNINMIRQITGINELMDATAPAPNTLVGTAEIAQQGTNNTLYNIYNSYRVVTERAASNLSLRIQNIIRYVDYKPYEPVIGNALVNVFKQNSPIAHASYGIKLRLKPQEMERRALLEKANFFFQQERITVSDIFYIEEEVKNGSIKMARIYMMYREELYRKQKAEESQSNVQAQSQAIMEQQQNSAEIAVQVNRESSNDKMNEMTAKGEADTEEYYAKHNMKKDQDDNQSKNKITENLYK